MVVQLIEPQQDSFQPKELDKEILDLEIPYLNAIEALMYLI